MNADQSIPEQARADYLAGKYKRGKGGNYGRRISSEVALQAPSLIRRPINQGVKHQDRDHR